MNDEMSHTASHAVTAVFWAGLACGVLDLTAALVTWGLKGVPPPRLLQGIAAGLLGKRSFDGGWETAVLGAACHFFIAFSAATVFYLASRQISWLTQRPFLSGPLYGVAVYLVMYWIVMPLSASPPRAFSWAATFLAIATHIVCVGSPIAFVISRFSR
jgi:uncharacterized membrane protein YagU involved in acid resistance